MWSDVPTRSSPRTLRTVGSLSRVRFIAILSIALSLGEIALGQKDAASIVGFADQEPLLTGLRRRGVIIDSARILSG